MKEVAYIFSCLALVASQARSEDWTLIPEPLRLNIGVRAVINTLTPLNAHAGFLGELVSIGKGTNPYPKVRKSEVNILGSSADLPITWFSADAKKSSLLLSQQASSCMPREGQMLTSRSVAWEGVHTCIRELSGTDPTSGKSRLSILLEPTTNERIVSIEPVLDLVDTTALRKASQIEAKNDLDKDVVPASPVWPSGPPGWHLQQSGLATAYAQVFPNGPASESKVQIAHLDTGYFPKDRYLPVFFQHKRSTTCFEDHCEGTGEANWSASGPFKSPDHGTGTLSNLAGSLLDKNGKPLSGNPSASVFSINIHDSVMHIDSRRMARGIEEAVEREADLITLSHGGLPSQRLASAVNRAYKSGTPIFAASSDFFEAPLFLGRTFRSVAFPARYANVMGVAGATQENESYGEDPSLRWWFSFGDHYFTNLGSWALRGSYGPTYVMSQDTKIAAFAPNITRSKSNPVKGSYVGNDGAGTSNSTPQVAAAASLWLEKNRDKFTTESWRSWKKSEAVYQALSLSANSCFAQYDTLHFGAGILQANQALQWNFSTDTSGNPQIWSSGRSPVPLAERQEVPIDILGAAEFLSSVSLPTNISENLKEAFLNALLTELSQLVFTSEKLQAHLQRFHLCTPSKECGRCTRQDLEVDWKRVAEIISDFDEASPTLKCQLARSAGLSMQETKSCSAETDNKQVH